ncbi:MAG: putative ABC transporter permease [Lachnospiraceae bacterium]|nr:putative ABC transporter permease [Lachnospiraceae bacterium]
MIYTAYELIWLFFIYSFLGWCLEVVYAAAAQKTFVNRGFLNGILCPVYGCSMVFMLVFMDSLRGEWFYLFLGCLIVGTVTELLTGLMLEKIFRLRLWDYSGKKFQAGGYICWSASLIWGLLGVVVMKFLNPLFLVIIREFPGIFGMVLLLCLLAVFAADTVTTAAAVMKMKNQNPAFQEIAEGFHQASRSLQGVIIKVVHRRMYRAFPKLKKEEPTEQEREELIRQKTIFAYGCSFHKVLWIFILGAFLGDLTETVFCRITMERWMSRSSVVYGPFSLVWGFGVAGATILLYRYREHEDRYIFLAGTLLGGAYEYICSVFTELAFGTIFWDYSGIPFNLGGRINLLYCFFWGIAALVWMKICYPRASKWIERVPKRAGTCISYLMLVFMFCNIIISGFAMGRYSERAMGIPAQTKAAHLLDERFPDERMEQIYPNMKMTK